VLIVLVDDDVAMTAIAFLVGVVLLCVLGACFGTDSARLQHGDRRNWR
jgi:hypothetical protein